MQNTELGLKANEMKKAMQQLGDAAAAASESIKTAIYSAKELNVALPGRSHSKQKRHATPEEVRQYQKFMAEYRKKNPKASNRNVLRAVERHFDVTINK